MRESLKNRVLWVVIVFGFLMFAYRGIYRGVRHQLTNDFFGIYTISKAWLAGQELYSTQVFVDTFQRASGYSLGRNTLPLASKYTALPGMVPLIAPFSAFRWQTANTIWVLFGAAILVLMLWRFSRISDVPNLKVLMFFICSLLLGPIHTGLAAVNITPLLVGLMGISYLLYRQEQWMFSGILLGIVGCCKPHIAGAMVLVLLVERAWKPLAVSVLTGLASVGLFVGRLAIAGVPWWHGFVERTRYFGAIGGANDFSLANSARYELTNMQVILGSLTNSRVLANTIAIAVGAALVIAWWVAVRRHGKTNLFAFATINVILLLPSYHRFDDISVVVFLLATAFLTSSRPWLRQTVTAATLVFLLPIAAVMVNLAETGRIPATLLNERAFQLTFLTFHIWFLLALSGLLLWKMLTIAREEYNALDWSTQTSVLKRAAVANS